MYKRYVTVAGKTILIREVASARVRTKGQQRKPKSNPTPEAVAKVNYRIAVRNLTALINANFKEYDLHLSMTYSDIPTPEEAMKRLKKFKTNMRGWCRRNGMEWKMIDVYGEGTQSGRPHHHAVTSNVPIEVLQKYWPWGYIHQTPLDDTGNYEELAKYLLKNAQEAKETGAPRKRRFCCTRTVITPQTRVEEMSAAEIRHDLKPWKGYYIPEDSINRYEHAILEVECVEYIMVSTEDEARIDRYGKGVRTQPEREYRIAWPEQMEIGVQLNENHCE